MQRIVCSAIFPFEGTDVGIDISAASDGDSLWNYVAKQWGFPPVPSGSPKTANRLDFRSAMNSSMQIITLNLCSNDPMAESEINIPRRTLHVFNYLVNTPSRHNVGIVGII